MSTRTLACSIFPLQKTVGIEMLLFRELELLPWLRDCHLTAICAMYGQKMKEMDFQLLPQNYDFAWVFLTVALKSSLVSLNVHYPGVLLNGWLQHIHFSFSELEPLNRDRVEQVFAICSELEELMKDTTFKRKHYPQQITEGIKKILQSKRELLVSFIT